MPEGIFAEKLWNQSRTSFIQLYLRHELRRGATWFTVILVVLLNLIFEKNKPLTWIFISLLPMQRALYSLRYWRNLALSFHPVWGAKQLLSGFVISQVIQFFIAWSAFGIIYFTSFQEWFFISLACLGAMVSSVFVALEGDSGRPWLVHFIALASGLLGGFVTYLWSWMFLFICYLLYKQLQNIEKRLYSIEYIDEDLVIS
ncbi:MAG: hypothetical protein HY843_07175 [Bdellovibrio sp.]|nr:hypothetical protein [Bdellovibrio sp.]